MVLGKHYFSRIIVCGSSLTVLSVSAPAASQIKSSVTFDIQAQPLARALPLYEKQSGERVSVYPRQIRHILTNGVRGQMTAAEALDALLAGTGLSAVRDDAGRIMLRSAEAASSDDGAVPEIVVQGSRSLNVDIQRKRDDPQPYVVFDAKDIRDSQAATTEEFLRTRLPMNTTQVSPSQNLTTTSLTNQSQINLRGLGVNQTLVLVDGRRRAAPLSRVGTSDFTQPDINGIPVAAIERIEILPAGAGGIYGGGATGGVINIILKRNYTGFEGGATYTDSLDFEVARRRYDLTGSFRVDDATRITFAGSYANGGNLKVNERDFTLKARKLLLANNPAAYSTALVPPIGYTPNIRSLDGSALNLKDGRVLSSAFTSVPVGYAGWGGPAVDNVAGLIANAGQYNLDLSNDWNSGLTNLLSTPETLTLNANAERTFGKQLRVFVEGNYSKNMARADVAQTSNLTTLTAAAAINPFNESIRVTYPSPGYVGRAKAVSDALGVTGGFIYTLGRGWAISADHSWSRASNRFGSSIGSFLAGVPAQFTSGAINVVADTNVYRPDFSAYLVPYPGFASNRADVILNDTNLRLSGQLFEIPGGPLTFSALLEHRNQVAKATSDSFFLGTVGTQTNQYQYTYRPERSQGVDSAYAEVHAPIVGPKNGVSLIYSLELQASVRHDRYETRSVVNASVSSFGSINTAIDPATVIAIPAVGRIRATKYTLGASWRPVQDIQLRASYATAFLPPNVNQIASTNSPATLSLIDPRRGGQTYQVTSIPNLTGGNPSLQPEESKSLSMGVILEPRGILGLRLSVDYTRIKKINEITALGIQSIVDLEDQYPDRVTRAAPTTTDPAGFAGRIIGLNTTLVNILNSTLDAIDFQGDYTLNVGAAGEIRFYTVATWQPNFERLRSLGAAKTQYAGFFDGPLEWRGNGGINWAKGNFALGWNMQYYDSYKIYSSGTVSDTALLTIRNQGSARVPSQTYHDLVATYRAGPEGIFGNSALENVTLSLGIQNTFGKSPPILASAGSVGGYSSYGDPRLRRFTASLRKVF